MKQLRLHLTVAIIFTFLFCYQLQAQINVNAPVNPQISCGLTNLSLDKPESAVDIMEIGDEQYIVAVSNLDLTVNYIDASLSINTLFFGKHTFANEISNPDVSLMTIYGGVFAVVVYFDPNLMDYVAESFEVTAGNTPNLLATHVLNTPQANIPEPNNNAIRIDANSNGDFVIVWEDFENNKISLVLFGLSEKVKNVFQILGLDQLIKIVNNKEEAKSL